MTDLNDSKTPRAFTYTEMMNGGKQRMNASEHQNELDLKQRTQALELNVEQLEKSLND